MAQFRITDNTRETFTGAASTTATLAGAAQYARSFSGASWSSGDTGPIVIRAGSEISVGIFTYNGTTVTQTPTILYSSNSGAAVTFSSGNAGEVYCDIPANLTELLNLTEITVASASTCDIGGTAVVGAKVVISGTVTITSLGTGANKFRIVRFSGAPTLTHNASSLILPGGANITAAAGDTALFASDSSGNWRCYSYQIAAVAPFDRRAPGAIGATTPSTVAATTISATGAVDLSAAGAGQISFPATQNASAGANVLDDYEEGTWTPSIGGNATYTAQAGTYTKIGRHVSLTGHLTINAIGTGSTGQITGAPFAAGSLAAGCVGYFNNSNVSVVFLSCYLNASTIDVTGLTAAAAVTNDPIGFFKSSADLYFSLTYQT